MCQEMLDQLARSTEWFNARGVRVAAVTMGKPYEAKMFCAQRSPDVVCLSNTDQSAYKEYGIGKIGVKDFADPGSWRAWGRVMLRGYKPGSPGEQDARQLGATFIIGTDGKIVLAHYNKYMGDHPDIRKLQAIVNEQFSMINEQ